MLRLHHNDAEFLVSLLVIATGPRGFNGKRHFSWVNVSGFENPD